MHWALILFASEVRRPVVVCWQQQALVDLDGERHSLKVSAKRGGLGTEPYTGHSGVSACPSRSSCFVRSVERSGGGGAQVVYYGSGHWSYFTRRRLFRVLDGLTSVRPATE